MGKKKKKDGVSKTDAIKEALRNSSSASPTEITTQLKAQGIAVTPGYVSTIKSNLKKEGRSRRKARTTSSAANGQVAVETLLNAKALIEKAGGAEKAKQALDVVTKLL